MTKVDEGQRTKHFRFGLALGLVAVSICFVTGVLLGLYFPNFAQAIIPGIIGVVCLIATPLVSKRSQEWAFTIFWFGIAILSVTAVSGFHYTYLALAGDPIPVGVWLTVGGFLVVFLPAYYFTKFIWIKPQSLN